MDANLGAILNYVDTRDSLFLVIAKDLDAQPDRLIAALRLENRWEQLCKSPDPPSSR
jgi:hypothetical protein